MGLGEAINKEYTKILQHFSLGPRGRSAFLRFKRPWIHSRIINSEARQ